MSFNMFLLDLKINGEALDPRDTRTFTDVLRGVLLESGYKIDFINVAHNNAYVRMDEGTPGNPNIRRIITEMLDCNDITWREPEEQKPEISTKFRVKALENVERLPQKLLFFKNQIRIGYPDLPPDQFDALFDIQITGQVVDITCKQPEPDITHLQRVIADQAKKIKLGELEVSGPF